VAGGDGEFVGDNREEVVHCEQASSFHFHKDGECERRVYGRVTTHIFNCGF
jgi:hypothetical protein